jgi:hypothetical protein
MIQNVTKKYLYTIYHLLLECVRTKLLMYMAKKMYLIDTTWYDG